MSSDSDGESVLFSPALEQFESLSSPDSSDIEDDEDLNHNNDEESEVGWENDSGIASSSSMGLIFEQEDSADDGDEAGFDSITPTTPFIPSSTSSNKHHRRRSTSYHRKHHPPTGTLSIPWLTTHLLSASLSPTLLSLPYALSLLSLPLFIPLFTIVCFLSAASQVVIVYLARYLEVRTWEEVAAKGFGVQRFGGVGVFRGVVVVAGVCVLVFYFRIMAELLIPVGKDLAPSMTLLAQRPFWTILFSLIAIPFSIPSHLLHHRLQTISVIGAVLPIFLAVVVVVGSVEEATSPLGPSKPVSSIEKRDFGTLLGRERGEGSAWGGVAISVFTTCSHLTTLPHRHALKKAHQRQFPLSPFLSNAILLSLSLPLAIVPYAVLPALPPPMILDAFPNTNPWIILARLGAVGMACTSIPFVVVPVRDALARAVGCVRSEEGEGWEFWAITALVWVVAVVLSLTGDQIGERVELVGVTLGLAISFLIPSVLFIVLFHLRSPLSIIFPKSAQPISTPATLPLSSTSTTLPGIDALLAKKEKQLQRRRTGRRVWQDAVVFLGVLPLGLIVVVWSGGRLVEAW